DKGRCSLHGLLRQHGDLTARDIFDAAAGGDSQAAKVVEETGLRLAAGAMELLHTIAQAMEGCGGGTIAAGGALLERVRWHIKELAFPVPAERTQIVFAHLGSDAGFIGAAACGRHLYYRKQSG